ncbi:sensor domain-containing protein [Sulfurospirillum arcachonense]|uniref:sensor domain-containing protein n=1 Tax=Sulfurospirillum arcachonense TaxID=57666 RepID=UPI0004686630|nr:sensor domain-containing diguanylate cyclase [Sulfurospirillum arcachonense]
MQIDDLIISHLTKESLKSIRTSVYWLNVDAQIIYVNEYAVKMYGGTHEELLQKNIRHITSVISDSEFSMRKKSIAEAPQEFESLHVNKFGISYPVQVTSTYFDIEDKKIIVCFVQDLTAVKKAEKLLYQYEKIVSSSADLISYIDRDYCCQAVNQSFCNAFGLDEDEIIGKYVYDFLDHEIYENYIKPYFDKSILGEKIDYSQWIILNDKTNHYIKVNFTPYKVGQEYEGVVINFVDITDEKIAKDRIEHMSLHDSLTDLPNRRLFYKRANQILSKARRYDKRVALLFIDLDYFKEVNDQYGHDIGDEVLIEISHRMKRRLRKEDTLARLGGDEFLVLVENICDNKGIAILAQELLNEFVKPIITTNNKSLSISGSIGISIFPDDAQDIDKLVTLADNLMYRAKEEGKNKYVFESQPKIQFI